MRLNYDMAKDNHEYFWEHWQRIGKPVVCITQHNQSFSKFIPKDAVIVITSDWVTPQFLHSIEHVEDATCMSILDDVVVGYAGNVKIHTIEISEDWNNILLPDCVRYRLQDVDLMNTKLDCRGRKLDLNGLNGLEMAGKFRRIIETFTNFGEIIVGNGAFLQFCREIPEYIDMPGVTLGISAVCKFNTRLIDDLHIPNLSLYGHKNLVIKHDPNTNLQIGNIVEYDECYADFVQSLRRSKRTKRANH